MNHSKKVWTKPTATVHPVGSEKYEQLMTLLEQEHQKEAATPETLPYENTAK